MAAPLTSLLKGDAKRLVCNPQAQSAFEELKKRFTTAPLPKHPDPTRPLVVEVDASNVEVGVVLPQQSGEPQLLTSRINCHFYRNYATGDKASPLLWTQLPRGHCMMMSSVDQPAPAKGESLSHYLQVVV